MEAKQLYISVGSRIKELRQKRSMSQQELAAACNFEKSNMSRIEAGRTNLTTKNAYKISQALNVKLQEIFNVED